MLYLTRTLSDGLTVFIRAIVAYFLMLDLLRSIHFGQPSTLCSSDSLIAFSLEKPTGSSSISQGATNEHPNEALHHLLAVLGQIHTLSMVITPLFAAPAQYAEAETPNKTPPSVPFSPSSELTRMRIAIDKYLEIWRETYLGHVESDLGALYYFCKLYRSLPQLQDLVDFSGYAPRVRAQSAWDQPRKIDGVIAELTKNKASVQYAWKVLDNVSGMSRPSPWSIWVPMVLFYSGLVVWASIAIEAGAQSSTTSFRVLELFQTQLTSLHLPCCREMCSVIDRLKSRGRLP